MADPGVSNERTALAWQRTALSLVAGTAVVARLAIGRTGPAILLPLAAAALLGLWIFTESRARYRHALGWTERSARREGRTVLVLSIATTLIAAAELVAIMA